MKTHLNFVFDLPEENQAFHKMTNALDTYDQVIGFFNILRNYKKHGHFFHSADEAIDYLYQMYCESFVASLTDWS